MRMQLSSELTWHTSPRQATMNKTLLTQGQTESYCYVSCGRKERESCQESRNSSASIMWSPSASRVCKPKRASP